MCKEESCEPDVFLLSVSLVDRFLSIQFVLRTNLQAVAGVCLFISSKVKAPQPLNAERIAYYTDGAVRMQEILVSSSKSKGCHLQHVHSKPIGNPVQLLG